MILDKVFLAKNRWIFCTRFFLKRWWWWHNDLENSQNIEEKIEDKQLSKI
jgi:hypothetical protein